MCLSAVSAVGSVQYMLSDIQGSTRAVMNNDGSSSAVIARHDYLPFGEEIASGIGLRTSGLGQIKAGLIHTTARSFYLRRGDYFENCIWVGR